MRLPLSPSAIPAPRRRVHLALAALALAQLSCVGLSEVKPTDIGIITSEAVEDGADVSLRVSAVFVRVTGLNVDIGNPENCWDLPYTGSSNNAANVSIDAGPSLTASISGNTQSIARRTSFGQYTYPAPPSPLAYNPGDTLLVEFTGADGGFTEGEIKFRTAERLEMTPVVVPGAGAAMSVAWTPAAVAGSVLTVSLRYPVGGTFPTTRQVYCVFLDDGAASVPSFLMTPFVAASPEDRSMVFTRVRVTDRVVAGRTRGVSYSYYSLPLPQMAE